MSDTAPHRSADFKLAAQAAHDHAITMGAHCSTEKAAVARGLTKPGRATLTKRKSPIDESPSMAYDRTSSAGRVREADGSTSAIPTEGTSITIEEANDAAMAQVIHDHAVHLGAACGDAEKLAPAGALAKIKVAHTIGRYVGPRR